VRLALYSTRKIRRLAFRVQAYHSPEMSKASDISQGKAYCHSERSEESLVIRDRRRNTKEMFHFVQHDRVMY